MKNDATLCACAVVITLETQKCRKRAPRSVVFNFFINCDRHKRFSQNKRRRADLQNTASDFSDRSCWELIITTLLTAPAGLCQNDVSAWVAPAIFRFATDSFDMSAAAEHAIFNQHSLDLENPQVIDHETGPVRRRVREAICIYSEKNTVNKDKGLTGKFFAVNVLLVVILATLFLHRHPTHPPITPLFRESSRSYWLDYKNGWFLEPVANLKMAGATHAETSF